MAHRWILGILAVGLLVTGCREEPDPSPQFNTTMSYEGRKLGPLEPPRRLADRALIGPAATVDDVRNEVDQAVGAGPRPTQPPAEEEPQDMQEETPEAALGQPATGGVAALRRAAESVAAVVAESIPHAGAVGQPQMTPGEIDLSTPHGTGEAFAAILRQGNYEMLGEVLADEIRAPVAEIVNVLQPVLAARLAVLEALHVRFPQHGLLVTLPQALTFGLTEDWTVVEASEVQPGMAMARVVSADGQITGAWPMQYDGEQWRIVLPAEVPFLNDPAFVQIVMDAAERLGWIAAGIADGTLASVDEAAVALDEATEATAVEMDAYSPL
jgi:hypothetical protein